MDVKRKRLKVLVDVWSVLLEKRDISREELIEILKREYERNNVEPFRGVSKAQDLYEKDLIALYLVGVYGLGLREEISEILERVLDQEVRYERASEILLSDNSVDEMRNEIIKLLNKTPDSALLSKIFRVEILKHYFGFIEEDRMKKMLRNMWKAFPEEEATVRRLSKFYIAYKVAEAIMKGEIRDWTTKEIFKQAIAVELGGIRGIPDDEYIAKISSILFNLKRGSYASILRVKSSSIHLKSA
ncbi:MAG: DUF2192 domain-containing protein [Sulfolobales archaeon]